MLYFTAVLAIAKVSKGLTVGDQPGCVDVLLFFSVPCTDNFFFLGIFQLFHWMQTGTGTDQKVTSCQEVTSSVIGSD